MRPILELLRGRSDVLFNRPQASLQNVLCVRLLLHLHEVNDRRSNLSSDMTLVELKEQARRRPAGVTDTYSCADSVVYVAPFVAHQD